MKTRLRTTALLAVALACGGAAAQTRPNIVWIIADDYSPDAGCYGDPVANTPRIDQLAAQGIKFTRAYSTSPVCSPSRSALITGMYQTSTGTHNHRTMSRGPLPGDIEPITEYLEAVGYQTIKFNGLGANNKTDFNFTHGNVFNVRGGTSVVPRNQPFFAQVDFSEPHRNFTAADNDGVGTQDVVLPPYYADNATSRSDWEEYLNEVHVLDGKVGGFVDWLDNNGLGNNTVVFFFGDHGRPQAWDKQFLWEGGVRVPLIVRWPAQIAPNTVDDRLVSLVDLAATTLDLAGVQAPPHMTHSIPFLGAQAQTRSHVFCARDRLGDAFDRIRSVYDGRYKYIRNYYPEIPYWSTSRYKGVQYPMWKLTRLLFAMGQLNAAQGRFFNPNRPPEELYDLTADPFELNNLIGTPGHDDALNALRDELANWIRETGDEGQTPEPDSVQAAALQSSSNAFRSFTKDGWDLRSDLVEADLQTRDWKPAASATRVALRVLAPIADEATGQPGEIAVVRQGDLSSPLTVELAFDGDATPGIDYSPVPDVVRFAAGQGTVTLGITPIETVTVDLDRTVRVRLLPDYNLFETGGLEAVVKIVEQIPAGAPGLPSETLLEYFFSIGTNQPRPGAVGLLGSNFATPAGGISEQNGNAFIRSSSTGSTLASALSNATYQEFSFAVTPGVAVDLTAIEFDHGGSNSNNPAYRSNVAIFLSRDGFATAPQASDAVGTSTALVPNRNGTKSYIVRTAIPLDSTSAWERVTGTVHCRLYFYDDVDATNRIPRIDNVSVQGIVKADSTLDAARFELFGTGCAGTLGTPTLRAIPTGARPRFGSAFTASVENVPSVAFGIFGLSNQRTRGLPLPFDASVLGMNGCDVLVALDLIAPMTVGSSNTALWTIPIPADGSLLGATFYQQALVFDPTTNALGLTLSNGGTAVIGY